MAPGPPSQRWSLRCRAGQVLRKELRLPTAVERGLETGARLRSRPAHAVQARRALLRRRGRRSRSAKGRDTRRLGGGTAQRGDGSAPPRGELGSDGGRRHAGCAWRRRPGDVAALASQPAAGGRAPRRCVVAPLAALGAARAGRGRASDRHPVADMAKARLRDRVVADHQSDAGPGRRRERASPAARADDRRLQLRARQEVRIPEPGAGAERRDEAPPGRHLAHAIRGQERVRRARSRGASCCCAARAPMPAGSSRCSRNRRRSSTPRRGRRRPRSSPARGRYSTSARSSRRRRLRRRFNSRARRSTRRRPLPRRNTAPAPRRRAAVPPPSTAPAATPSASPLPIAPAVAPPTAVAAPAETPHAFGPPPPQRDIPPPPGPVSPPSASAPPPTAVNGQAVNSGAIPGTAPRPVEKAQP